MILTWYFVCFLPLVFLMLTMKKTVFLRLAGDKSDEVYSVTGDKGEIGFIDYQNDGSAGCFNVISAPFPFKNQKPQPVTAG